MSVKNFDISVLENARWQSGEIVEQTIINSINVRYAGSYKIYDNRDLDNARQIINLIENHQNAFQRSRLEGHVTASAFVIDHAARNVLLTHHAKLDSWLQLGGHCDGIRNPRSVALQEAHEESGLDHLQQIGAGIFDIDIHQVPEHRGTPAHLHYDIRYLFKADMSDILTPTHESKALAWVPLSKLETFTDKPSVLVLNRKLEMQ